MCTSDIDWSMHTFDWFLYAMMMNCFVAFIPFIFENIMESYTIQYDDESICSFCTFRVHSQCFKITQKVSLCVLTKVDRNFQIQLCFVCLIACLISYFCRIVNLRVYLYTTPHYAQGVQTRFRWKVFSENLKVRETEI